MSNDLLYNPHDRLLKNADSGHLVGLSLISRRHPELLDEPDSEGRTALIRACMAGHVEAAKLLISKTVNPNIQDAQGNTALHHAVTHLNQPKGCQLAQILFEAQADPSLINQHQKTPLQLAEQHCSNSNHLTWFQEKSSQLMTQLNQRREAIKKNQRFI